MVLCALVFFALAGVAGAATLKGTLIEPGIVWISDGSKPKPVEAEMHNAKKTFEPLVLIVPVHSGVRFPNDDPYFHSIYSASDSNPFDIGFYASGPGKLVPFDNPGVDVVRCHIHSKMLAWIAAVDGPSQHATTSAFELVDVRRGSHVLHAWGEKSGERTRTVTVPRSGVLSLERPL